MARIPTRSIGSSSTSGDSVAHYAENAAIQVTTAALITGIPSNAISVMFQNLGPVDVYIGTTAAKAASTVGIKIPANGGTLSLDVSGGCELYASCGTLQVSPADTRWFARTGANRR